MEVFRMPRFSFPLALIAAVAFVFTPGAANAQVTQIAHTWVSSSGTACTRTAPCTSFPAAQAATLPGGVIDSVDYSGLTITKSLTIRAEGSDAGVNSSPSISGPWIFVQAGATDVVTLEGLHFNGGGIRFDSGGHFHVVRCTVNNQNNAADIGIKFQPNSASKLSITEGKVTREKQ
jgi:hypothetical protein